MTSDIQLVTMRVARPTLDLDRIRAFYENVVGLALLWSFTDHDGFDGAIYGLPGEQAQLEIVRSPHGDVPAPTGEDVLVLYHRTRSAAEDLVARLRGAEADEITDDPALNPFWPRNGAHTFRDPDGYGLIVLPAADR